MDGPPLTGRVSCRERFEGLRAPLLQCVSPCSCAHRDKFPSFNFASGFGAIAEASFPPPTPGERRHRRLACWLVAVRRYAVLVAQGPQPECVGRFRGCLHDAADHYAIGERVVVVVPSSQTSRSFLCWSDLGRYSTRLLPCQFLHRRGSTCPAPATPGHERFNAQLRERRPRQRLNRPAHLFMPPFR